MTAHAAPPVPPRSGERFARRVVTGCAVLVVAACFGFSFGNVLALGQHLQVPPYVAWLIAPAVDLTVVGLIVGVRHLSLRGMEGRRLRPARLMLIAAGLATWALNTAHALFVRGHLGVVAYDSLAPLLLIGWAEVGPWFLRQFRAAATPDTSTPARAGRAGRAEVPTAARVGGLAAQRSGLGRRADPDPAQVGGGRPRPAGDLRPPGRPAAPVALRRAAGEQAPPAETPGDQSLLDRARALNAAHWQAHGRQISRDKLRAALGIGASRAERLLAALTPEPPSSPPAGGPAPVPARAALPARPDRWAALRAAAPASPGGPQGDGRRG